jgi:hypothetical protein
MIEKNKGDLMKKKSIPSRIKILAALIFLALMSGPAFAQTVIDLGEALRDRRAVLSAAGNGSSSGTAVEGYLTNSAANTLRININISGGLYLANSGGGQNMVAVQIFLGSGAFYSDGRSSFIQIGPGEKAPVILVAFCADFDLPNPSAQETFAAAAMPSPIRPIASKIARFTADDPMADLTVPAQLALWFSQGETPSSVAEKFSFSSSDEETAREIMAY